MRIDAQRSIYAQWTACGRFDRRSRRHRLVTTAWHRSQVRKGQQLHINRNAKTITRRNATFENILLYAFIVFVIFVTGRGMIRHSLTRIEREVRLRRYQFPAGLRRKLAQRFPQYSNEQWREVLEGLRDWFAVARRAGSLPISMPSQAVDEAWHEFILHTRSYHEFCSEVLGRYLHHVPAEAMQSPIQAQEGLRRTWKISCMRESISPRQPRVLPRLFALDAMLGFPGGFTYAADCRRPGKDAGIYCASHIGCSSAGGSGCGSSGCGSGSGDGSDGGGGGCGGD